MVNWDDVNARFEAARAGRNGLQLPWQELGGCSDKRHRRYDEAPPPGGTTGRRGLVCSRTDCRSHHEATRVRLA
ncbi:hypothetical protein ALI22I_12235 [Saccharothrix sp. ALI-22-I]|nr:hypothetical protein ALI22I_12235 [Saccharothrix sp. ALI-22-I]